ncbi:helix-turn-helix domain-containing protein [Paenibacillus aestuarii]|uniref:Helix-turn-helix domain-containing protein n=1 Tax=Paenibacillus aestuarii TaxID=516965 RepID=A0ABW0KG53_9BACL|nr:helix-turn-helix domain-containing protein [Paenibacillus aestuarii]
MHKNKLNALEKLAILQEIESGQIGVKSAVRKYGFSESSLVKWQRRYQLYGYVGLEARTHNHSYSDENNEVILC